MHHLSSTPSEWGSPAWLETAGAWASEAAVRAGFTGIGPWTVSARTPWRVEAETTAAGPAGRTTLRCVESLAPHRFEGPLLRECSRFGGPALTALLALDEDSRRHLVAVPRSLAADSSSPHPSPSLSADDDAGARPTPRRGSPAGAEPASSSGSGRAPGRRGLPPTGALPILTAAAPGAAMRPAAGLDVPAALLALGRVQRSLAQHRFDLQKVGAAVTDASWVPMFLENQVRDHAGRAENDPLALTSEQAQRLQAATETVAASSAALSEESLPLMLDPVVWEGSFAAAAAEGTATQIEGQGEIVFLSLQDALISHPFTVLRQAVELQAQNSGAEDAELKASGLRAMVREYLVEFAGVRRSGTDGKTPLTEEQLFELATHAVRLAPINEYSALMRRAAWAFPAAATPEDHEAVEAIRRQAVERLSQAGSLPQGWNAVLGLPSQASQALKTAKPSTPRRARRAL